MFSRDLPGCLRCKAGETQACILWHLPVSQGEPEHGFKAKRGCIGGANFYFTFLFMSLCTSWFISSNFYKISTYGKVERCYKAHFYPHIGALTVSVSNFLLPHRFLNHLITIERYCEHPKCLGKGNLSWKRKPASIRLTCRHVCGASIRLACRPVCAASIRLACRHACGGYFLDCWLMQECPAGCV